MASIWAKIGRIVYGAGRDVHAMYFAGRLTRSFIAHAYATTSRCAAGFSPKECAALYFPPDADIPKDRQFNR